LKVDKQRKKWPEKKQRETKWLNASDAALLIDEPRLVTLIREFYGVVDDKTLPPDRQPKTFTPQLHAI